MKILKLPSKTLKIASFFVLVLAINSCKNDDGKFDVLQSGGSGSNVDQLEIVNAIPDQSSVIIEIGEERLFLINAVAPFLKTVSYSWIYDGSLIANINQISVTGASDNVGSHTLVARASDGDTFKERGWSIKVNGPPIITPITTGLQQVSVNSTLQFQITASDPNSDSLSYEWVINGVSSPDLVGNQNTAVLTGTHGLVGSNTVTVFVDDGTQITNYSWTVEVNYLSPACNNLAQGEICTFAGGWNKGSGLSPFNPTFPLRFRPFSHYQDSLGNLFFSDLDNNVVWYWNKTVNDLTRVGIDIPAGVIKVVAGTGEAASGPAGSPALESSLNSPRGLWYDEINDRLFIAEYSGNQVKYVDTTGTVFTGLGGSTSHVDGDTAFSHDCNNPAQLAHHLGQLYVSCYGHHRVKRWDLSSDLAYTVAGDGGNDIAGENAAATASGAGRVYGLFVDNNGIYMTNFDFNVVRFVNTTLAPITFFSGHPDQTIVNPGMIATIIGDGTNGTSPVGVDPKSGRIGRPSSVFVRNNNEIYVAGQNSSHLVVANNSGLDIVVDQLTIPSGKMSRISSISTAGYNGSNLGVNSTRFNQVYHFSVDNLDNDNILVSDNLNFRFRSFNPSTGDVTDVIGTGRGRNGFYGDILLPHYSHLFDYPTGLAFDSADRTLFFSDQNNHRIRQMDRFGRLSTAVGRGVGDPTIDNDFPSNVLARTNYDTGGTQRSFINSVELLPDGSLMHANVYSFSARIWNRSGVDQTYFSQFIQNDRVSTIAGDWTAGAGNGTAPPSPALSTQLNYPNAIRYYDNGGLLEAFLVDTINHCIRHIDSNGTMTVALGLCGTAAQPGNNVAEAAARFNRPRDVAIDSLGNLFISDANNHQIWYWNRSATPVTMGVVTINPNHVAVIGCVGGTVGSTSENILATSSRCNQPVGLALHSNQLCFAQRTRHNVRCINTQTGQIRTVAGRPEVAPIAGTTFDDSQEGIPALTATLFNPSGVAFDSNGDLYISDTYNHVIRKVKLSGP